jgi:hypothetical protein
MHFGARRCGACFPLGITEKRKENQLKSFKIVFLFSKKAFHGGTKMRRRKTDRETVPFFLSPWLTPTTFFAFSLTSEPD